MNKLDSRLVYYISLIADSTNERQYKAFLEDLKSANTKQDAIYIVIGWLDVLLEGY